MSQMSPLVARLSKGIDDAPAFLSYVIFERTLFLLSILFSIMCTFYHRRDYDEQKAVAGPRQGGVGENARPGAARFVEAALLVKRRNSK